MEIGTPFIIEAEEFENHSVVAEDETQNKLPFEFSRTRTWNESLYNPEIGSGHSITALTKEISEIKELVRDIKNILKETFEL